MNPRPPALAAILAVLCAALGAGCLRPNPDYCDSTTDCLGECDTRTHACISLFASECDDVSRWSPHWFVIDSLRLCDPDLIATSSSTRVADLDLNGVPDNGLMSTACALSAMFPTQAAALTDLNLLLNAEFNDDSIGCVRLTLGHPVPGFARDQNPPGLLQPSARVIVLNTTRLGSEVLIQNDLRLQIRLPIAAPAVQLIRADGLAERLKLPPVTLRGFALSARGVLRHRDCGDTPGCQPGIADGLLQGAMAEVDVDAFLESLGASLAAYVRQHPTDALSRDIAQQVDAVNPSCAAQPSLCCAKNPAGCRIGAAELRRLPAIQRLGPDVQVFDHDPSRPLGWRPYAYTDGYTDGMPVPADGWSLAVKFTAARVGTW